MTEVYPSYYPQFRCRAGVCKNTCCRGWEIDIDSETREFYRTVGGDLGQKLRQSILDGEDGASLRLVEDERCPFLLDSGLCQLILELGEDKLCQICTDHPRFRSFFSDRTEVGIGLCCEAAAELVLSQTFGGKRGAFAGGIGAFVRAGNAVFHRAGPPLPARCADG